MLVRDLRIRRTDFDRATDDELVWSVVETSFDYLEPHSFENEDSLASALTPLTTGQKSLLAIHYLVAEVSNGGFHQFLWNSTGSLWREAVEGLRRIGVSQVAELVEQAVAIVPAENLSRSWKSRQADVDKVAPNDFQEFDQGLYANLDNVYSSAARYVKENESEFFSDEPPHAA